MLLEIYVCVFYVVCMRLKDRRKMCVFERVSGDVDDVRFSTRLPGESPRFEPVYSLCLRLSLSEDVYDNKVKNIIFLYFIFIPRIMICNMVPKNPAV